MKYLFNILISLCFVLAVYAEGVESIGIFTYDCPAVSPWDPDSIQSGITGSEEAIIYISKELADLGLKVTVFANPPENSLYSKPDSNPRYVKTHFDDGSSYDVAIAWRMPGSASSLKKRGENVYLWPHDTHHYRLTPNQINDFTDTLWLSEWQRKQWMSINIGFAKFHSIFGNGIIPEQFTPVKERTNPYSCIYGSNYARGLEILLDIWPEVKQEFPKATLDIYYGWQHWGLLSAEKEAKMRAQVAALQTSGVTDHGLVGHKELNLAYEQASFWTYPCVAPETFCITALRAQMSGAIPVIIEGSALKETVRHGYSCKKPEEYLSTLKQAMNEVKKKTLQERRDMSEFILGEYTWKEIAKKWKRLFDSHEKKQNSLKQSKTDPIAKK